MKQIIFFAVIIILIQGCKKEQEKKDPLKALTDKNTAALKNTEWYGLYRNKGETLGNNSGYRGYAIAFGADSSFTFYGPGVAHNGYWSVNGDTARFRFASGAQNSWASILNSDSTFRIITPPAPDNFTLDRNLKKIPDPPSDVIGHKWKENSMSTGAFILEFKDKTAGMGYPSGYQMSYTIPPVKNKIFNVSMPPPIELYFLLIVDGKTAWTFDNTAYNFQYNY